MGALADKLCVAPKRPAVVADCVALIDAEVAAKGGISGLAIKGGYAVVKAMKPGMIPNAMNNLLDEFLAAMEDSWAEFQAHGQGRSLESYLAPKKREVANRLLAITDRRRDRVDNEALKKAYNKLRGYAQDNVEAAVPAVARLVERHMKP